MSAADRRDEQRLDPGVEALVAHLHGRTLEDVLTGSIEGPVVVPAPVPGVAARDVVLPGDPPVAARRYDPVDGAATGPLPAVVWVHGGAWCFGELDEPEADAVARRLCARLGAVVVSVDYRLAPAHRHPAALDDVVAAVEAVAVDPTVDPARLVLGGASAGGHLAAAASQVLRDRGGARPAVLFLAYPATDPHGGPYPVERPACCPRLLWFDRDLASMGFDLYLGGDADAPDAVPAEGDLRGLPPTLIATATLDALAPQAERYGDLLRAAGVEVVHHEVGGVLHGYLSMVGVVDAADEALARHAAWIDAAT